MPIPKRRGALNDGPPRDDAADFGPGPMMGGGPASAMSGSSLSPAAKREVAGNEAADKTSAAELDAERQRSRPSPVVPKQPTSAALSGGAANVTQARGGGGFDRQPEMARAFSNRPTFGSMQGLMGGGIGVPGLEQTGSEAQASPLLLALMQKLMGRQ